MIHELKFLANRKHFNAVRFEMVKLLENTYPHDPLPYIKEAFYGGIKSYDAFILSDLLKSHKPKKILEIGCFLGLSSRWILESTKDWQAQLVTVDPNIPHRIFNEPQQIYQAFAVKGNEHRVTYHQGFFSKEILENELTRQFPDKAIYWSPQDDEKFDFIFIDAGHSYEEVKYDYELALNYINPNGLIVFHDTLTWEGVAQLMREIDGTIYQPWWYKCNQQYFNNKGWYIDGVGSIQKT